MHVDIKSGNAMDQNHFVTPEQFNRSIHCISNLAKMSHNLLTEFI